MTLQIKGLFCKLSIVLAMSQLCSCAVQPGMSFEQFDGTEVSELAHAAKHNRSKKIRKLLRDRNFDPNYHESKYGHTVLMVSLLNHKRRAVEALLANGVDPNARTLMGQTPLIYQVDNSYVSDCDTNTTAMLIRYGADVNAFCDFKRSASTPHAAYGILQTTALIEACKGACLEKIQTLIAHGADPDQWVGNEGNCPLSAALIQERIDIVKYLIMTVRVKIPPYAMITTLDHYTITVAGMLRLMLFDLGTPEYYMKMEVVNYLQRCCQIDYFKEPLHPNTLRSIKSRYPYTWQEYLNSY